MAESLDTLVADSDRATTADELRQHLDRQLPRNDSPASLRVRDLRWSSLALQYALINLVCILVWAFSGAQLHDFWPKWVLLGTLIMYLRRLGRRSHRRGLPPSRER